MRTAQEKPLSVSVLIASGNEHHTRTDRSVLRSLGAIEVDCMGYGVQAALMLLKQPIDVVLCDHALRDMSGVEFVRLLRLHPRLAKVPVVMASSETSKAQVLEATEVGCCGYVVRPYSLDGVLGQFSRAAVWTPTASGGSESLFFDALAPYRKTAKPRDDACSLFEKGMALLARKLYDMAIAAFNKAVRIKALFAEAYEGIAKAWRGKGNLKNYRRYMTKAAEVYAVQKKYEQARDLFLSLHREDPSVRNPFFVLSLSLVKKGQYRSAVGLYEYAFGFADREEEIHEQAIRACYFTDDPLIAARDICREMAARGLFEDPWSIYDSIVTGSGLSDKSVEEEKQADGAKIRDIWSVCRRVVKGRREGCREKAA